MPKKINILPEYIANKIAAGEVVQRPESVVKELIENSIDANAKNIQLIIKDAGKSLIQVIDDGDGMSEEDAEVCLFRHATSKIKTIEDLEEIKSFGFRGEALASIAAVSRIEIKTRTIDSDHAVMIQNDESNSIIKTYGSGSKGTSVAVKNLFYNTPARRNFLRSNATEFKRIVETFKRLALPHPDISFKFYNENDLIYDLNSGSLEKRITELFGVSLFENLIYGTEKIENLFIKVFLIRPNYLKKNKGEQYLFVNNRFVINRQINHAIYSAYENIIEKGDYPFFIAFLEINPKKIDVNVHPSKLEIKFDDENFIYSFIRGASKKIVSEHNLIPRLEISLEDAIEAKTILNPKSFAKDNSSFLKTTFLDNKKSDLESLNNRSPNFVPTQKSQLKFNNSQIDEILDSLGPIKKTNYQEKQTSLFKTEEKEKYPFIVQLHNKYILAQVKSGLAIIDQHIAHERILYEKILKTIDSNLPFSQQLLLPYSYKALPEDIEIIKELKTYLENIGYNFEIKADRQVIIYGIPPIDFGNANPETIFSEIIQEYKINNQSELNIKEKLASAYACKAAIKSGEELTEKQMRILVDQLFMTSMPYVCPHGRPVLIKLTIEELDKKFGRL